MTISDILEKKSRNYCHLGLFENAQYSIHGVLGYIYKRMIFPMDFLWHSSQVTLPSGRSALIPVYPEFKAW